MPQKPPDQALELAYFETLSGPNKKAKTHVHFNPESLQYTVQNTIKEEGRGSKKKQHVSQTTAKLTMQLVFDTTDTGEDVRVYTDEMAKLLQPYKEGNADAPPQVGFNWGLYKFTGLVEQYKETIDFFAAGGVPLRSSVDITLASQEVSFNSGHNPSASVDQNLSTQEPTVHRQAASPGQSSGPGGASGLANALGDPRAARAIASANGAASLRFGGSAELSVGGSVNLQAAAAFATGASVGGGIGIGGGIGASAGAGLSIGAGASAGIGFSAGASAGFSASASTGYSTSATFAQVRTTGSGAGYSLPSGRALFSADARISTGANAQFAAGGRAEARAGSSLGADVGAGAELNARISFT
jgi:hypothetical protein